MLRPIAILEESPLFSAIVTPPAESGPRRGRTPRRFAEVELASRAPRVPVRVRARRSARPAALPGSGATARPLHLEGPPIEMVTLADPEALAVQEQFVADGLVAELEAQARRAQRSGYEGCSGLDHAERYPGLPQWLALRGSAFALHALYRPSQAERLAHGFAYSDFLRPLFHDESAVDTLRALLGPERAQRVVERHRVFCETPMSDEARLLMGGAVDARAIRQRALIAARSVAAMRSRWVGGARIAAVGAGTGDAVAQIAAGLDAPALTLVDRDPMALAAASVVARERVPGLTVHAALARRGVLAELAAAGRFDAIDLTARSTRSPTARPSSCCAARGGRCARAGSSSRRPCSTAGPSRRSSITSCAGRP